MNLSQVKKQGFTLVEMIVVIAIIAILAAVIIPTTAGFIERARLSNDRQTAANMTQALQSSYILGESTSVLTPAEARDVINAFAEDNYDFSTTARNAAFFYVPNESNLEASRIVILTFDDAESIPEGSLFTQTEPLRFLGFNTVQAFDVQTIDSPEQLFGNDRIMISTSGSPVAEFVYGLRNNLPPEVLEEYLNQGFFTRLIRGEQHKARLEALIASENPHSFHPDNTLYVDNGSFTGQTDSPTRVLYAPGIRHLPAVPATVGLLPNIPSSVRTHSIDSTHASTILGTSNVQAVDPDALPIWSGITATRTASYTSVTYDLGGLQNRHQVKGYDIVINGDDVTFLIFTDEGLAAKALVTVSIIE